MHQYRDMLGTFDRVFSYTSVVSIGSTGPIARQGLQFHTYEYEYDYHDDNCMELLSVHYQLPIQLDSDGDVAHPCILIELCIDYREH